MGIYFCIKINTHIPYSKALDTLLVFKRFCSTLDLFVAVSAVVHVAPIVGAAI